MNEKQNHVFKNQLLFGGAVVAGLSHELNNVVAIICELNGLLEDLSTFTGDDNQGINPEKLKNIKERIATQTQRGKIYIKQLNSFAHSVDGTNQDLDSYKILQNVVDLCERSARLFKVKIVLKQSKDTITINSYLFDLQHVLFRCIWLVLCASKEGTSIDIELAQNSEYICFKFTNEQPGIEKEELLKKIAAIKDITKHLGGKINMDIGETNPIKTVLFLPYKLKNNTHKR